MTKKSNIWISVMLFMIIIPLATSATYYIDSIAGSDTNNGLSTNSPIKTITKLNTISLNPGDSVLFRCGGVWRLPTDDYPRFVDGKSNANITYTSYGLCTGNNKPLFLGSIELSNTSNWSSVTSTIWKSRNVFNTEVGNIIYNNGTFAAIREENYSSLNAQGEYFWNYTDNSIYIYSVNNPGTYYKNIEAALTEVPFHIDNRDYLVFNGLKIMYGSEACIKGETNTNVHIINSDFDWCGGDYTFEYTGIRFGDCVALGMKSVNNYIINNTVNNCADSGITIQSWVTAGVQDISNIFVKYNIIKNTPYGIVVFSSDENSIIHNYIIDHNTFINTGNKYAPWSNVIGNRAIRIGLMPYNTTIFNITNNIFYNYSTLGIDLGDATSSKWKGLKPTINYNLYSGDTNNIVSYNGTSYSNTYIFCSEESQECNGQLQDTNLDTNLDSITFKPQSGSPACSMSSSGSYVGAVPCDNTPITNSAPTQGTPYVRASDYPNNTTSASLTCYNTSTTDVDGDSVTNTYKWYKNNVVVSGLTTRTISSSNTAIGEVWKCEIRPFDGTNYGTAKNSSTITILTVCGNNVCEAGESCSSCSADCGTCDSGISSCTLTGRSWNEDSSLNNTYNLSDCFYDPLDHRLVYRAYGNDSIIITISSGMVSLSAPADWSGSESIYFTAYDTTNYSRRKSTNSVTLTVNSLPDCGDNTCEAGESCTSCPTDCGACPVEEVKDKKSSGGGSSSSSYYEPTVVDDDNQTVDESTPIVNESTNESASVTAPVIEEPVKPSNDQSDKKNAVIEQPSKTFKNTPQSAKFSGLNTVSTGYVATHFESYVLTFLLVISGVLIMLIMKKHAYISTIRTEQFVPKPMPTPVATPRTAFLGGIYKDNRVATPSVETTYRETNPRNKILDAFKSSFVQLINAGKINIKNVPRILSEYERKGQLSRNDVTDIYRYVHINAIRPRGI